MKINNILIFMCLISFCVSPAIADPINFHPGKAQYSTEDIDRLLGQTDKIRTSGFQKFSENLSTLTEIKKDFTPNQLCFYQFLSAYKLGLSGDIKQSIQQLKDIEIDCKDLSITIRVESLLANIYAISGEYQKALSSLDIILSEIDNISDKDLKLLIYSAASVVYDLVNQYQLSLDFSKLIINQNPPTKQLCKASVYKYTAIIKLNHDSIQESEISKVINHCRQQNENLYAEVLNVSWLDYQLITVKSQKETQLIYNKLLEASESIAAIKYKNLTVFKNSLMARVLEKLVRFEEAIEFAKLSLEGSVSLGNSQQKIDALQVLINYYQSIEKFKEANIHLIEKNQTEIKFYSDKQEKLMAYQTLKHDGLAKSHQIKSLNQQNEVLILGKELAEKSKTNQLLLSYFFASLVLLLLYIGYRIKKQQQIYKSLSEMDFMTKIYNRKGIKDFMEYLLPYSEKKGEIIAFGVFDLDLFKKVNDQYGHTTGDWVIKSTIKACKSLRNEKATFARLGGEEFAIILRDSSLNEITEFAEQCRLAVYDIKTMKETGNEFHISASFGITTTKISGYDFSNLMSNADDALYKSKENGRNQVSIYNTSSH
jgi:diguanylate cyclase (GGDEF)-like protein